jgi:hypothetical protein
MRLVVAAVVVAILGWFVVAVAGHHGKQCHFNTHLKSRIVCTDSGR